MNVIPNCSSGISAALCPVANGRFVEGARSYMSAEMPGPGRGPGPAPTALSATGRTGEGQQSDNDNTGSWTNANGT